MRLRSRIESFEAVMQEIPLGRLGGCDGGQSAREKLSLKEWVGVDRAIALFTAGFGEGFFVAGDGLQDGVEAEAFEDVADGGTGFGEDDSAAGVFGGGGGGEEHGEGRGGDHVD